MRHASCAGLHGVGPKPPWRESGGRWHGEILLVASRSGRWRCVRGSMRRGIIAVSTFSPRRGNSTAVSLRTQRRMAAGPPTVFSGGRRRPLPAGQEPSVTGRRWRPWLFRSVAGAEGAAHVAGNAAPVLLAELQVVFLTLREDVPHEGVESRVRAEAALDAGEQPLGIVLRQVRVRS